jgi:putative toxin-antitoxin system antitoxin component (TIGR02293 family)
MEKVHPAISQSTGLFMSLAANAQSDAERQYLIYDTVVGRAVDVFGSELKATRWLSRQNPDFGGKSPLEALIDSSFDPTTIFDTLGKVEHGI